MGDQGSRRYSRESAGEFARPGGNDCGWLAPRTPGFRELVQHLAAPSRQCVTGIRALNDLATSRPKRQSPAPWSRSWRARSTHVTARVRNSVRSRRTPEKCGTSRHQAVPSAATPPFHHEPSHSRVIASRILQVVFVDGPSSAPPLTQHGGGSTASHPSRRAAMIPSGFLRSLTSGSGPKPSGCSFVSLMQPALT
jgi:hypothetical protein